MILYIADRNGNVLAEYSHFFNDKHHRVLTAGASTFEFSVNKHSVEDTSVLQSGNGVILRDDNGRDWYFVILSYSETQYQFTVQAEDASIELLNRMMDEWPADGAHPFAYYVNKIIDKTPWRLGTDQTVGKSRTLTYTGQDTGLGRLLSVANGFDNVELEFRVHLTGLKIDDYYINAYNQLGSDRTSQIQLTYQNELNNITKTESREKFVTAMRGIGSVIEPESTGSTTTVSTEPEKHVDFADLEYDDGTFKSPKGDPFLYAVEANKTFNVQKGYIEGLYSYDTSSPQELLNRTLTQLKTYSEPSVAYDADVKKIDASLDLGDTIRIIDHDYPSLYLQARVAELELSYTDPSRNTIKFANYQVLTSGLNQQLETLRNMLNSVPSNTAINVIRNTINNLSGDVDSVRQQAILALTSANGKNSNYYGSLPPTANEGDTGFIDNADGTTTIWVFKNGKWEVEVSDATGEEIKKAVKQALEDTAAAKAAAQSAFARADEGFANANSAIAAAGFASNMASVATSQAIAAQEQAGSANAAASDAQKQALSAYANADKALTSTATLATSIDAINGTMTTLATAESVNKVAGTVSSQATQMTTLAGQMAAKLTANDVNGLLDSKGFATQNWAQNAIDVSANGINASINSVTSKVNDLSESSKKYALQSDLLAVQATSKQLSVGLTNVTTELDATKTIATNVQAQAGTLAVNLSNVTNQVNNLAIGSNNLILNTSNITTLDHWSQDTRMVGKGSLTLNKHPYYHNGQDNLIRILTNDGKHVSAKSDRFYVKPNTVYFFQVKGFNNGNVKNPTIYFLSRPQGSTADYTNVKEPIDGSQQFGPWGLVENSGRFQTAADDFEGYIRVDNIGTTDGAAGSLWFVEAKMAEGNVLTDYSPAAEDSASVNQLVSLQANLNGLQATVINNQAGTANQFSLLSGLLNSKITDVTTGYQNQIAQTSNSLLAQISGVNLVNNSEFNKSGDGKSITGWHMDNPWGATVTNQMTYHDVTYAATGTNRYPAMSQMMRHDYNATMNWIYSDPIPVTKSAATVSGSLTVARPADTVSMPTAIYVYAFDASKNKIGTVVYSLNVPINHGSWTVYDFSNRSIPSGAAYLSFCFAWNSGVGYFGQPMLQWGPNYTGYTPSGLGLTTALQLFNDNFGIGLRNNSGDIITGINGDSTGLTLMGKKIHIDGQTTIDNGVIKSAMIQDASIGSAKIVDGAIVNAKIANLDGSKIIANSITADKIRAEQFLIGVNNGLTGVKLTPVNIAFTPNGDNRATMTLDASGLHMVDTNNYEKIADIVAKPAQIDTAWYNGLVINLQDTADFFQLSHIEGGNAITKLSWSYSNTLGYPGGFMFNDQVQVNGNVHIRDGIYASSLFSNQGGIGAWLDRTTIDNRPGFVIHSADRKSGIFFSDDGQMYLGNNSAWYSVWVVMNKLGMA